MRKTWLELGAWNSVCDVCGFNYKNYELRKRWDGLMVCEKDWEPRHPQELIRPIPDQRGLPWTRPAEDVPTFSTVLCTPEGQQAIADIAVADCAICNFTL